MIQGLKFSFLIVASVLIFSCNTVEQKSRTENSSPKSLQRFAMVTGLKAEKIDYYKQLHAAAWPAVLNKIKECNIQNYSIYLKEIDGKPFLFSYFEYTGNNFDADMKKMAADTTTQRWWKETDPTQNPLPDAAAKKEIWSSMEEVFHAP